MIEIYLGDGKGKTTAAAGLTLRAAGNGIPVLFIQFMKDGSSGEIKMLKELPGVTVHYPDPFYGFASAMNEQQKEEMRVQYKKFLKIAAEALREQKEIQEKINRKVDAQKRKLAEPIADIALVIVLDEVIHACNKGLVRETELLKLMEECPDNTEIILTGRSPSDQLLEKADYISEIKKCRHPFDKGVPARKGIEK